MSIEELILRIARGEAGAGEAARVSRWRLESLDNARGYAEILRVGRLAARLERIRTTPVPAAVIVGIAREREGRCQGC